MARGCANSPFSIARAAKTDMLTVSSLDRNTVISLDGTPRMRFWIECGDFIRESRRHFRDTGALLPSSRFLAQALVSELRKRRGPGRILEVGPGTGSVTAQILRHLMPGDQLDVVELNKHFIEL